MSTQPQGCIRFTIALLFAVAVSISFMMLRALKKIHDPLSDPLQVSQVILLLWGCFIIWGLAIRLTVEGEKIANARSLLGNWGNLITACMWTATVILPLVLSARGGHLFDWSEVLTLNIRTGFAILFWWMYLHYRKISQKTQTQREVNDGR